MVNIVWKPGYGEFRGALRALNNDRIIQQQNVFHGWGVSPHQLTDLNNGDSTTATYTIRRISIKPGSTRDTRCQSGVQLE